MVTLCCILVFLALYCFMPFEMIPQDVFRRYSEPLPDIIAISHKSLVNIGKYLICGQLIPNIQFCSIKNSYEELCDSNCKVALWKAVRKGSVTGCCRD